MTKRSPEQRARMGAAVKAALADPDVRARMSEARRQAWTDPDLRARMCAAMRKPRTPKPVWTPPPEQARYFRKLLRNGFSRAEARAAIEGPR
jgi:hypothetical protein